MIYFIQNENGGPIKIGYAEHSVESRIATLQIGNPYELICLASMEGGVNIEKRLHQKFDKYHVRGEWFEPSEEILDFIRNVDKFDPKSLFTTKKKKIPINIPHLVEELYTASMENNWEYEAAVEKFKNELYKRFYTVTETLHLVNWFESNHRKRFEEKRAVTGLQLGEF